MITVTRLNGKSFAVNAIWIETVEETPDTLITLTNGKKWMVRESAATVVERIQAYMRTIGAVRAALPPDGMEESDSAEK